MVKIELFSTEVRKEKFTSYDDFVVSYNDFCRLVRRFLSSRTTILSSRTILVPQSYENNGLWYESRTTLVLH